MSRFLIPTYQTLSAYTPGEQPKDKAYIKLNTNESPYPPSPEVQAALREGGEALRLYPDPESRVLRERIADYYGLTAEEVFVANGSDDILNFAFMAFCGDGVPVFAPEISYSFYPVYAALHGRALCKVALREDFSVDPAAFSLNKGMVVLANPNAPTGLALTRAELRGILEKNPDYLVLIDEAYVDFGAESAVPLIREFPNLLVVMTYSKSRSLAGGRLGFALGQESLIADLALLKYSTNPYNVSRMAEAVGVAAIDSAGYYEDNCRRIAATREKTIAALAELGFHTLPSLANFFFTTRPGIDGERLYTALKAEGLLVRHFDKAGISDYIRVTVGAEEEMAVFVKALSDIVKKELG